MFPFRTRFLKIFIFLIDRNIGTVKPLSNQKFVMYI